jgi:hypothetical protein
MIALSETFGWAGFDGTRSGLIDDSVVRLEDRNVISSVWHLLSYIGDIKRGVHS